MKRTLYALLLPLALLLSACTQNNGDISPWFGYWVLTSMTDLDGEPVKGYDRNIAWAFQNDIIKISSLSPYYDLEERYGTWKESDDGHTLTLDFTHWEGQGNEEYLYQPPAILGLSADEPNVLAVKWDGDECVTLTSASRIYRLELAY